MISAGCHMTRSESWEDDNCSKALKQKTSKVRYDKDFWYTLALGYLVLIYEFAYIQFCWVWS